MNIINRSPLALAALIVMGLAISGWSLSQELGVADSPGPYAANDQSSEVAAAQVNSNLKSFDLSNNGVIDDDEFFRMLDFWVTGGVTTMTFFEVADAWISQADLGVIQQKSNEPDKSRIRVYRSTVPMGGMYLIGYPGAVEPYASVIIKDEMGNVSTNMAEFDGSFRFSSFDLPDGFDHTLGSRIEVTTKDGSKSWSNPIIVIVQFN